MSNNRHLAQDEREAFEAWPALAGIGRDSGHPRAVVLYLRHEPSDEHLRMIQEALRTRPAQTEQQPTLQQISDYLNGLDAIQRKLVEREARSADRLTRAEQQPVAVVRENNHCPEGLSDEISEYLPHGTKLYAAPIAQIAPQHPDDAAVDRFAAAMKAKLAKSRAKGRGGWDDPNVCSVEFLAQLLVEHLGKGNTGTFEDVANFAMMLHQRGADPKVLAEAAPQPQQSALVEALKAMLETYGPPAAVADKCTYPVDHPITKARAALSAKRGETK